MTQGIYHFEWDCGRSGNLEGWFLCDEETIKRVIGRRLYFGEVLGKHSEIYGELSNDDIHLISDKLEDVAAFTHVTKLIGKSLGWNPLQYIRYSCSNCGNDYCFVTEQEKLTECCDEHYCGECVNKHNERYHTLGTLNC